MKPVKVDSITQLKHLDSIWINAFTSRRYCAQIFTISTGIDCGIFAKCLASTNRKCLVMMVHHIGLTLSRKFYDYTQRKNSHSKNDSFNSRIMWSALFTFTPIMLGYSQTDTTIQFCNFNWNGWDIFCIPIE